jgi:hypothetical protein
VLVKVAQPERLTFLLEVAQQAEPSRQGSDQRSFFRCDPGCREGLDDAVVVENTERRVLRVRDGARLVRDTLEHLISVELRCERKAGAVDRL